MKIFQSIGTPGATLPQVVRAAAAARWGVDKPRFVELPMRDCDLVRPNPVNGSRVLDRPSITATGVPLSRCERSP